MEESTTLLEHPTEMNEHQKEIYILFELLYLGSVYYRSGAYPNNAKVDPMKKGAALRTPTN